MSQTTVVKVKVQELSKFGFKANDRYVGLSKNLSEADKTRLVPGAEFEAEYYIADSGKEYLNKILKSIDAPHVENKPAVASGLVVDTERAKRFTPKFTKTAAVDNSMSKADWAQKDRNMMIGGRSHDAAVIVASMVNVNSLSGEQALSEYKFLLEGMLKIADEVK
jgi:hypothetical protein